MHQGISWCLFWVKQTQVDVTSVQTYPWTSSSSLAVRPDPLLSRMTFFNSHFFFYCAGLFLSSSRCHQHLTTTLDVCHKLDNIPDSVPHKNDSSLQVQVFHSFSLQRGEMSTRNILAISELLITAKNTVNVGRMTTLCLPLKNKTCT